MSVIQTIRNRYGKIAGAVIAIALIGFIISDARNGSFGSIFGGHDNSVMKVEGEKIDPKEYQQRIKEFEVLYTMFNKGRTIDDATRAQMNEQTIQRIAYEALIAKQCDKLGIQTTEEEKKELIYGANAHQLIRQFQIEGQQIFINPQTNSFDPQIVKYFEKQLAEEPQKIDPNGKIREQWETVKAYVYRTSRLDKYTDMFGGSVYPPVFIARQAVSDRNSMAVVKYVKIPFAVIPDNEVKVSDDDIKAYMQKHAALYQNDQPTRSIEYVSFDIIPAAADTFRTIEAMTQVKNEFGSVKDNRSFVNNKSDEPGTYSEAYLNKRTFMSKYADTLMALPVGTVYGPYYESGSYKVTKIVDKKVLPDSVKCRHILVRIKAQGKEILSDSMAKARIDSAIAAIKAGASFDSVVMRYSEDNEQNKKKGGEYTFTLQEKPGLDSNFGNFIFFGKKGESKLVKADNPNYTGYHYIEILDQKGIAPAVQSATVAKNLVPSDSTVNALYGKANEFAGRNTTTEAFDAAAKKANMDKRVGDNIRVNSFTIPGLGAAREVIRWTFENNVGTVSPVFQLGDQRYVVAKIISAQEKGLPAITSANRPMLEQKVKDEKKAEIIAKKFTGSSLEAIAQSAGQQVQQTDSVMLGGSFVPNLGYEPKVIGYAFNPAFQQNTVSPAIHGQSGVYYILVPSRAIKQADANMAPMIAQERMMMERQTGNALGQMLQQAMIKGADIKYNPANF